MDQARRSRTLFVHQRSARLPTFPGFLRHELALTHHLLPHRDDSKVDKVRW